MQADIYHVFNSKGELIRTRLVTGFNCYYRGVVIADYWSRMSKTHIDLGSQCCFFDTDGSLTPIEAMRLFDSRFGLTAEYVFTIHI
jgi:hypothetical protein